MATSVTLPGQFTNNLGQSYGPDSIFPPVYLTGATLTGNAAAFPTLNFAAYASLEVKIHLLGFTGSDLPSARFNGDSGNNYYDRNLSVAQGATLNTNTETATTSQIRMGVATTKQMVIVLNIVNTLGVAKLVSGRAAIGTGTVATPGVVDAIVAEWVNTTAAITSLSVQCVGANSFLSGSSIYVLGGL